MSKRPHVCTAADSVDRYADATGALVRHVPAGKELDELLTLVRIGLRFRAQQKVGKKPGALARLVLDCARRAGPPYTFEKLLMEMAYAARRRALLGEYVSPVLEVDRSCDLVTINLPKRGIVDVPFGTLRNHLTRAKNILHAKIPAIR